MRQTTCIPNVLHASPRPAPPRRAPPHLAASSANWYLCPVRVMNPLSPQLFVHRGEGAAQPGGHLSLGREFAPARGRGRAQGRLVEQTGSQSGEEIRTEQSRAGQSREEQRKRPAKHPSCSVLSATWSAGKHELELELELEHKRSCCVRPYASLTTGWIGLNHNVYMLKLSSRRHITGSTRK